MIGAGIAVRLGSWALGGGLPWILGGLAVAGVAGWIWIQGNRIDALQADLVVARGRAELAERLNRDLAAELDRQAAERVRTEAALAAERDAAQARAAARGRAEEEIRNAPETADRPFDPGVGAALRRLHGDAGADR